MLLSGPQPAVDVRTGGPIGLVSSQLIAPGLNMIGARAGCRYVDRVPQYLNNLFRLGLVWFSRETLRDPLPYQVVEAQPEVLEAMKSVRFATRRAPLHPPHPLRRGLLPRRAQPSRHRLHRPARARGPRELRVNETATDVAENVRVRIWRAET